MIVTDFWKALQAGKMIKDPATWKDRQLLGNALAALVAFAVSTVRLFGFDIPITDEQIVIVSGGAAAILGVANAVLTVITTTKIGITGSKP